VVSGCFLARRIEIVSRWSLAKLNPTQNRHQAKQVVRKE
jgi:hypothetical protein